MFRFKITDDSHSILWTIHSRYLIWIDMLTIDINDQSTIVICSPVYYVHFIYLGKLYTNITCMFHGKNNMTIHFDFFNDAIDPI
jgi:hypothetical protein